MPINSFAPYFDLAGTELLKKNLPRSEQTSAGSDKITCENKIRLGAKTMK